MWTNPNIIAEFAAQKLSINLSNYKDNFINFLEYIGESDRQNIVNIIAMVGTPYNYIIFAPFFQKMDESETPLTQNMSGREFKILDNTGITFYNTYTIKGINNKLCIPYRIYGIKHN